MPMLIRSLGAAVLLFGCSACTFHRTVVNKRNRDIDVSSIETGRSTYMEVISALGPPADVHSPDSILQASFSTRALSYKFYDSKTVGFFIRYFLFLDWSWNDTKDVREILILFGDDDKVSAVYESVSESIWRPFSSDPDRGPTTTRRIK